MEMKQIKKVYDLSEFEEEASWLSEMHEQGWKLAKIKGTRYLYEACEPGTWIYQMDCQDKTVEKTTYLKLFEEYGWEFVLEHGGWFYFRKKAEVAGDDVSLFSDKDSKIAMCERILAGRLTVNVGLFLASCVIAFLTIFMDTFTCPDTVLIPNLTWLNDFIKGALPWVGAGMLVATSYSFAAYLKIRGKIALMKNPLE